MCLSFTDSLVRFGVTLLVLGGAQLAAAQERFTAPMPNPDDWDCAVRGRVIDDSNKPVAHAMIVLDDVHHVFFSESDSNGNFIRESHCTQSPIKRILFVTSPFVLGGIVPIDPPDYRFLKLGPSFAGQSVVLKRNETLNVGDVRPQVYFSKLVVTFQNSEGKRLFPSNVDWRLVWLRVRDKDRRVVTFTSMSINELETYVRKSENVISVYLPEGEWLLELSPFEDKGPWYKSSTPIVVRRSSGPSEITLRLSK